MTRTHNMHIHLNNFLALFSKRIHLHCKCYFLALRVGRSSDKSNRRTVGQEARADKNIEAKWKIPMHTRVIQYQGKWCYSVTLSPSLPLPCSSALLAFGPLTLLLLPPECWVSRGETPHQAGPDLYVYWRTPFY